MVVHSWLLEIYICAICWYICVCLPPGYILLKEILIIDCVMGHLPLLHVQLMAWLKLLMSVL